MRLSPIVAFVAALTIPCAVPPAPACPPAWTEEELSSDLVDVGEQIDLLWHGTLEERRSIGAKPWPRFAPWRQTIADVDRETLLGQIESLERWLWAEDDAATRRGVMRQLATIDLAELTPLFLAALEHPSPDVRWAAVERFVRYPERAALDELRRLWRSEPRERIRIDAALALAVLGETDDVRTWRAWLDSEQATYAEAGARALAAVRDESALERVAELARDGDEATRLSMLKLLPSWPTATAIDVAFEAARGTGMPAHVGLRALASIDDERARRRLLELAQASGARAAEVFAAVALRGRAGDEQLVERLVGLVDPDYLATWSELTGMSPIELHRNNVSAVGGGGAGDAGRRRAEASGVEPLHRDPSFDERWRVAEPGVATLRCSLQPGVDVAAVSPLRIRVGSAVEGIHDVVEDGDVWFAAAVERGDLCWVRQRQLEPAGDTATGDAAPRDEPPIEFDLPLEVLSTDELADLIEDGLVETFDPGADVIGIRVLADADDPRVAQTLSAMVDETPWPLAGHLARLSYELAERGRARR